MTPVAVGGRRIPAGSGAVLGVALVGMLFGLQGGAVATPSVGAASSGKPAPSGTAPATSGSRPVTSAVPSPVPAPMVQVSGGASSVTYTAPTTLTVAQGTFTAVQVSADGGQTQLDGTVSADGTSWTSQAPPKPASSYQVTAQVTDAAGQPQTSSATFQVAAVPASQRLAFTVTPDDGTTVGIGQPIDVRFASPVTERAAIEKAMVVDARTPTDENVSGSWHWLSSTEVHWRPQSFWTPGTTVHLDMQIAGVKAAAHRYGRTDYAQTFTIGSSHITRVDATTDRARVYRDGQLVATWPTGTGRPGLATYSGTYVVLGKSSVVTMDSCSARITCDKKDPDYYNEKEYWATRITNSGTFVHAASWDGLLGRANISHGCIHLSDTNAQDFYNHAVVGDVVIVTNTGRGPGERIATQDPGLYDWNLSWADWVAGSALK